MMKLENYTYNLPESLIASHPPEERGSSRLLSINRKTGEIKDDVYQNIADYFKPGDVLVLNDTKVIKARLFVRKPSGAEREIVVLERHTSDNWFNHKVMYRGKLKVGDKLTVDGADAIITVTKILGEGIAEVQSTEDLRQLCEEFGAVPLPPYMRRDATPLDVQRYQTVFADENGSVAAPTASLNMTDSILQKLKSKGVKIHYLTLHVGLGTFMPIRVDDIKKHHMHQEYFEVPASTVQAVQQAKQAGNRVIALGTTVTRTLEYAADDILSNNASSQSKEKSIEQAVQPLKGEADIFIYPGYKFKLIDGLVTNFHAPKSTVLMLASAFAGWDNLLAAYNHAITAEYRFLSYGDSMIIS